MSQQILGPRHLGALLGLSHAPYIGVGNCPTFKGRGPSIPWRLMSGLVDRGLVEVKDAGRSALRKEQQWAARLTEAGRAALAYGEVADGPK
jgi:hypothetical protein